MILIGIGANLPGPDGAPPLETCRRAVIALGQLPGLVLKGLSRWYETEPVPPSGQPPYINGVAHLAANPGVGGRVRGVPNAARTLDLDIIAIGDLVRAAPDPILPHPRAHLRAFVLAPLADVAPDWVHPVLRRSVAELLAGLPAQAIRAL